MKTFFLLIVAVILLESCNHKNKGEIYHNQTFLFELRTGTSRIVLNNTEKREDLVLEPFVLYYINCPFDVSVVSLKSETDTLKVKLTYAQSDSIFILTNRFIQNFKLNNVDTIVVGKTTKEVLGGEMYVNVRLTYKHRSISANIDNYQEKGSTTKEYNQLFDYLLQLYKKGTCNSEDQKHRPRKP